MQERGVLIMPSTALDAAFRRAIAQLFVPEVSPTVVSRAPRRQLVRQVTARTYRGLIPIVRPIVLRWRRFNSVPVIDEVHALRQDLFYLIEAMRVRNQPIARSGVLWEQRVLQPTPRLSQLDWTLDGRPVPHLEAAIELIGRRGGGLLELNGSTHACAAGAAQLWAWLESQSTPAGARDLTVTFRLTRD